MVFSSASIRQLVMSDLPKAIDLYASAFRYDSYFTQQFHTTDAYKDILSYYEEDISNTILYGIAYGAFTKKGKLISAVFAIDPLDWKNNHPECYASLFQTQETETSAWCDYMLAHFKMVQQRIVYIYGLVVDEDNRCKGHGTRMLKYMISKYGNTKVLVGDPSEELTIKLWLKNGFHKEYMGTVMTVVRR